jgi:hypothetical protein
MGVDVMSRIKQVYLRTLLALGTLAGLVMASGAADWWG